MKPGQGFHEVGLGRHHFLDVLVHHRNLDPQTRHDLRAKGVTRTTAMAASC
jgi:hypothetical protein